MLFSWLRKRKLQKLIDQGLQIADDCRLVSLPNFGSEPYLVSIGRHVTITSNVSFITHDGGTWVFRDQPEFKDVIKYGRIVIHDNCFIGYHATLMPGVTVGPNSIVAAGSVVAADVPPGTIVGGIPAKVIMTVEEYARKCAEQTPPYDKAAYKANKRGELERMFPRPW
jgi:acetyltransferase-like isoleucine patch superfamily enzyme